MVRFALFVMMLYVTLLGSLPRTSTSEQTDSLLYLKVAGKGYITVNAKTGQEKFNYPDFKDKIAAFSPNRSHFYMIEDTQITVYDSHTGQISKMIQLDQPISKDMPYCNVSRSPMISSDERWFYNTYSYRCNDVREDILRVVDLEHGKVIPTWFDLRDFCGIQNEINNVVLLQCNHGFFDFDLTTQQLSSSLMLFAARGPNILWNWVIFANQIAYVWKDNSKVSAWDTKTAHPLWQVEIPPAKTDYRWMRLVPDRSKLMLISESVAENGSGTSYRLLNTSDGNKVALFDIEYFFLASDTSWNGSVLYGLVKTQGGTNLSSDTIVAIDALTGQTIYKVKRAGEKIEGITFVP